jgi:DNA-binding LytR/AlgR family response regulator
MVKINILVVEDESIVSKDIQHSLLRFGYGVSGSCSNGEKAIELIHELNPDVVLMDINLKGSLTGIETAEIIKKEFAVPVIFLTAYSDDLTLTKAVIAEPFGYIIKPFKEIDLHTNIELAVYKHQKEQEIIRERNFLYSVVEQKEVLTDFFFVKANSKLIKLRTQDVFYVEALKDYVVIHTAEARYTIHSTMKDIEMKLGNLDFVRVHRSFIVRMDKIASIEFPNLSLEKDKKIIPIGGSYRDDLSARIQMV